MAGNRLQVFIAAFDDENQAAAALEDFRAIDPDGSVELVDAVLIVRGADGKVRIQETADASDEKWAKRGAVAGALVGLIFPPSIVGTAVIGGIGGGIWGKVRDKGFRDEDLKAVADRLQPGTSAIIAIAEDQMIERLQSGLERYRSIARHTVSTEAAAQIVAEVGPPASQA